jgi:glycosyltransferase involved in cell wall biosynthesis
MRVDRRLRVAIYDPSGSGGICHYTFQLAESLSQEGAEVTVITLENYELSHLPRNFHAHFLFNRSRLKQFFVRWKCRLFTQRTVGESEQRRLAEAEPSRLPVPSLVGGLRRLRLRLLLLKGVAYLLWTRPDVVHFQWLIDQGEDLRFLKLLRWLGFRIVYTAHDLLPPGSSRRYHQVYKKIYQAADRIVVHSRNSREELLREFDLPADKIQVIPHGSYDLFYAGHEFSKKAVRAELAISPDNNVILFFGLIKRYKGLEYLVEAFRQVQQQIGGVTLLIVGQINDRDPDDLIFYSNLIRELAGRKNVVCVPEYVPFHKIGSYFVAADLVVLPYVKTYTSGVLLSAYAAGRPVVVTKTGALTEVVEPGKTGLVVPPGDPEALAAAIVQIVSSRAQIDSMGRYAKHLADTTYSWKNVALKTIEVYRSMVPGLIRP